MKSLRETASSAKNNVWQAMATVICLVVGLAMIVNNQLGGEAMWFWYATVFHRGAHLYSDLHTPLQPLFVLELDCWMRLFGVKVFAIQALSLLHLMILCLAFLVLLRESSWKDWQKGIAMVGCFMLTVGGHSYRFDDYHVIAEFLILYSMWLLILLSRTHEWPRQRWQVAALGALTACTITTRVTDGVALLACVTLILCLIVHQNRLASLALYLGMSAGLVALVVSLTGDSIPTYLASTIFRAAASKGGPSGLMASPFMALWNVPDILELQGVRATPILFVILCIGLLLKRYWRVKDRYIFPLQIGTAVLLYLVQPSDLRHSIRGGLLLDTTLLWLIILLYVIAILVLDRFVLAHAQHRHWDVRESLYLLPLMEWASYSAGAAAEPLTNYYAPIALLFLLFLVLDPLRKFGFAARSAVLTVLLLVGVFSIGVKFLVPYSWQNYVYSQMFANRESYHHSVYGRMYIDRDLLHFSERVCADIRSDGQRPTELLSLPYPYPNYFCNVRPWHNYVQTFFDTSTRASVERLINELNTAPPKWIVYQRQMTILVGAERLYNHQRPLAQRDMDTMILNKIHSGEWKLVDQSGYLGTRGGNGWFIIRTHE